MPSRRSDESFDLSQAALRGAIAGAAGAAAMLLAERLAEHRVVSRSGTSWFEWGNRASSLARRSGHPMRGRRRAAAGVGMQLVFGAALGALYGAARSRGLSDPAQGVLESLLAYGAFLSERQRPSARGLVRTRARRRERRGVLPVAAHDIFGAATARAFQALLR